MTLLKKHGSSNCWHAGWHVMNEASWRQSEGNVRRVGGKAIAGYPSSQATFPLLASRGDFLVCCLCGVTITCTFAKHTVQLFVDSPTKRTSTGGGGTLIRCEYFDSASTQPWSSRTLSEASWVKMRRALISWQVRIHLSSPALSRVNMHLPSTPSHELLTYPVRSYSFSFVHTKTKAATSPHIQFIIWVTWSAVSGIAGIFTLTFFLSILSSPKARGRSFNVYVLFITFPDMFFSIACSVTCGLNAAIGQYYSERMCAFQTFYTIFAFASNAWLNADRPPGAHYATQFVPKEAVQTTDD